MPLPPNSSLCLCKWPAPVSTLTSCLPSHLIRKEVYFKCRVIYGGKSLAPAIHLSSQGHTCRGASIPGVTHIYFLPGVNAPGGIQESSLNYKRVWGRHPPPRASHPQPEPPSKSPFSVWAAVNCTCAGRGEPPPCGQERGTNGQELEAGLRFEPTMTPMLPVAFP